MTSKKADSIVGWRAYYTHNRQFDSSSIEWMDLPDRGVLGIVVFHNPPYRTLVRGGDWYYRINGFPKTTDTVWNGWVDKPDLPDSNVKRGAGIPTEDWEQISNGMFEDTRWP